MLVMFFLSEWERVDHHGTFPGRDCRVSLGLGVYSVLMSYTAHSHPPLSQGAAFATVIAALVSDGKGFFDLGIQ
jgi:hypothetical protein